jgi:hypothetical protein
LSVRDSAGAQTLLTRRAHAEVQESAIMHFIGGLIAKVASDLGGQSEKEQFAFLAAVFQAMKRDAGAVVAGGWKREGE